MTIGLGPHGTGKLRIARPGVLLHFCPGCGIGHEIDINGLNKDLRRTGWDGDIQRPTIAERVQVDVPGRGRCEYILQAGVLFFTPDCWHPLAGKSRHLEEFPLP